MDNEKSTYLELKKKKKKKKNIVRKLKKIFIINHLF